MPPKNHETEEPQEIIEAVEPADEVKADKKQPTTTKTKYIFPDIVGGGPSVTIEATSIEEATELFRKDKPSLHY